MTLAAIWWAARSSLTAAPFGLAFALPLLLVTRFVLGAGEAVIYPASNRVVAKWIPVSERGLANGVIFMGVGVGAGITPPLVTSVMLRFGWRASFVACGLIGVLAGAVWRLDRARQPGRASRRVGARASAHSRGDQGACVGASALLARYRSQQKRPTAHDQLFLLRLFRVHLLQLVFHYLSTVRGMQLKDSALYAMLPFIAMAIGSALGGYLNDRLSRARSLRTGRCGVAIVGIGLAAVFIAVGTEVESARIASVILAGGAGTLYLAQSSFWSVSADIAGSSAGTVSGVMNMGAQLGGVVTASLTPWIAGHFGWASSFQAAAVLCVIGAAAWTAVQPGREIARRSHTILPTADLRKL